MKKNRTIAICIDYFIILLITSLPLQGAIILQSSKITNSSMNIYLLSIYILLLFKDTVHKNASIGKKIMKIEVLKKDGNIPKISILILRNAFLIIWPLEVFFLIKNNQRIGDLVFGTKVVDKVKI